MNFATSAGLSFPGCYFSVKTWCVPWYLTSGFVWRFPVLGEPLGLTQPWPAGLGFHVLYFPCQSQKSENIVRERAKNIRLG